MPLQPRLVCRVVCVRVLVYRAGCCLAPICACVWSAVMSMWVRSHLVASGCCGRMCWFLFDCVLAPHAPGVPGQHLNGHDERLPCSGLGTASVFTANSALHG